MDLSERKLRILQAIVDDYIVSGMPIGSRTISRMWGGRYSPATIRNEMSDLEEMGYLEQPHTSAGRVPSDAAYRLHVDRFLQVPKLSHEEAEKIRGYLQSSLGHMDDVITTTARVLSETTDYVAMVLPPQRRNIRYQQIRLIPVTRGRALAVFVTDGGLVKDVLIPIPEEMDERYLETVSNALTEQMRGKTIQDLPQVVERLRGQVKNGEGVFRSLIESVRHQNQSQKMRSIVFDGTKNLFKHQEYNNLERAQNFLAAMDTRELFYDMLSQAQQMQIHISIGSENEDESLKDSSIVTTTYSVGGQQCGSFGVIGPTRMNYARVLAIMNYLTQCMDQMLGDPKDRE